jgi:hypothetical protein
MRTPDLPGSWCATGLAFEHAGERLVVDGSFGQRPAGGQVGGAVWVHPGGGEALDGVRGGQGVEPAVAGGAAGLRDDVADRAHPGQAAVGVGVEADGGDRVLVQAGELVTGVGLEAGTGEEGVQDGEVSGGLCVAWCSAEPRSSTSAEALYLKWAVSTTMRRITPGKASRMITWSWPSSRRRRVSQPSPMVRAWSGRIRWAAEV